ALLFVGAPAELAAAFRDVDGIEIRAPRRPWRPAWVWLRAAAARGIALLRRLRERRAAARVRVGRIPRGAVLISGFWDWSVTPRPDGALSDRYAKALPDELSRRGMTPAWLCWLDPDGAPAKKGRPWRESLSPLAGRADV